MNNSKTKMKKNASFFWFFLGNELERIFPGFQRVGVLAKSCVIILLRDCGDHDNTIPILLILGTRRGHVLIIHIKITTLPILQVDKKFSFDSH